MMKTGVLVHGCNLNIENWRHVAWGDPPDQPGRIPQGIFSSWQFDAEQIVFGTGASAKPFRFTLEDSGNDHSRRLPAASSQSAAAELLESEYTLEYLRLHFNQLRNFDLISANIPAAKTPVDSPEWVAFREGMLSRIVVDTKSQNTVGEIREAADKFLKQSIQQIVLVSSPSHIIRCLRDATAIFSEEPRFHPFRTSLLATPSVTCYEGTTPNDVVVVEPPHRPDRHVVPTHRRIQRMLTLQKLDHGNLVKLIEEFDELLQRFEHRYFQQTSSNSDLNS